MSFYNIKNNRHPENEVDPIFVDRWSPRSFHKKRLTIFQINALFEAAKWAPSCYNEQPWLFMYATKASDKKVFLSILYEKNKLWAENAPLLMFALARRNFKSNGNKNIHSLFDLGSAWLSMALQARRMGFYAHAMAGFNQKKAYQILGVDKKEYNITVAIAAGYCGNLDDLSIEFEEMEHPNNRKMVKDIIFEGFPLIKKNKEK